MRDGCKSTFTAGAGLEREPRVTVERGGCYHWSYLEVVEETQGARYRQVRSLPSAPITTNLNKKQRRRTILTKKEYRERYGERDDKALTKLRNVLSALNDYHTNVDVFRPEAGLEVFKVGQEEHELLVQIEKRAAKLREDVREELNEQ